MSPVRHYRDSFVCCFSNLDVGHDKCGGDVHLDQHAEERDDRGGPGGGGVRGKADEDPEHDGVKAEEAGVGPAPSELVGQEEAEYVAGALNEAEEEHVEEGVAGHVGQVDHDLVVDEGGGSETDGADHRPDGQGGLGEQAEVSQRVLLGLSRKLLDSDFEVGGLPVWPDLVCLCDLDEDLDSLLGLPLGDQPPRGLRQHLPGEEEQSERGNRDNLYDLPGGDQVSYDIGILINSFSSWVWENYIRF